MQLRSASSIVLFALFASPITLSAVRPLTSEGEKPPFSSSDPSQGLTQVSERPDSVRFEPLNEFTVSEDALKVLAAHIAAVGKDWRALRLAGQISLPSSSTSIPSTLLLQGGNQGILQLQQQSGLTAVVVEGMRQKSVFADGTTIIDSYGAGVASLLAFHLIHSTSVMQRIVAAKVHNSVTLDGVPCDKLTVRLAPGAVRSRNGSPPSSIQIDYYLDPNSHFIRQTVVPLNIPGFASPLLQVTSYSDYRESNGAMLPRRFSQTVNGSLVWSFSVSSVDVPESIGSTEFNK